MVGNIVGSKVQQKSMHDADSQSIRVRCLSPMSTDYYSRRYPWYDGEDDVLRQLMSCTSLVRLAGCGGKPSGGSTRGAGQPNTQTVI